MKTKNLAIIWRNRLNMLMFTDFLSKLYLAGSIPDTASSTIFTDVGQAKNTLTDLLAKPGDKFKIYLIKMGSILNTENPVIQDALDRMDSVLVLNKLDEKIPDPRSVTILKNFQEFEEICQRWVRNIEALAGTP